MLALVDDPGQTLGGSINFDKVKIFIFAYHQHYGPIGTAQSFGPLFDVGYGQCIVFASYQGFVSLDQHCFGVLVGLEYGLNRFTHSIGVFICIKFAHCDLALEKWTNLEANHLDDGLCHFLGFHGAIKF